MFQSFHSTKGKYNKGQIFPFAIAIIVIIVIMAMITVNLGKIAISKTDVTNAADAAALAGASVLSGSLLGFGLTSDMQAGRALVTTVRMAEIFALGRDDIKIGSGTSSLMAGSKSGGGNTKGDYKKFPSDLIASIWLFGAHLIDSYSDYFIALNDGAMAWSNAKQRALQYAFNNVGIDEPPKVRFRDYKGSYNKYLIDESVQSGFSGFMKHQQTGYSADLLKDMSGKEIKPGTFSPVKTVSGYGWTQRADGRFSDSYPGGDYKDKDNYAEVEVEGSVMYPLEILSFHDYFGEGGSDVLTAAVTILAFIKYVEYSDCEGWWCYIIDAVEALASGACFYGMIRVLPSGFSFPNRDINAQTAKNPIRVKVTRHKKVGDMGIWSFGSADVSAQSAAHVYQEESDVTIEPLLIEDFKNLGKLVTFSGDESFSDMFKGEQATKEMLTSLLCGLAISSGGGMVYAMRSIIKNTIKSKMKKAARHHHWPEFWANVAALSFAAAAFSSGPQTVNGLILEYIVAEEVCKGEDAGMPDVAAVFKGLPNILPDEWFNTQKHLFESELEKSFLK